MTFARSCRRKLQLHSKLYPVCGGHVVHRILSDWTDTQLPAQVDYFHSLVPLDLNHQKNATIFGFPSWVYKAQSSKDGNFYVLRRLEGILFFFFFFFFFLFLAFFSSLFSPP